MLQKKRVSPEELIAVLNKIEDWARQDADQTGALTVGEAQQQVLDAIQTDLDIVHTSQLLP